MQDKDKTTSAEHRGLQDDTALGLSDLPVRGDYELPQVVKGRMLCISHGQVCYRRVSFTGEKEWVCPDERHWKPIQDS